MVRKAKINPDTFDKWTYENSWALGLFTADGSISSKSRPHEFKIYSTDMEIIEVFKKVFESDKKVYVTQGAKGRMGKKPVGMLQLSNPKIADFFRSINVMGAKDERNPFSFIPDKYKWSFVKGLFDGDGNCYKGHFSIAGRKQLTTEVYHWICKQLEKEPNKLYQSTASKKTIYFQMGRKDAGRVLKFMEEHAKGTYNSEKYNKLKNLNKATLGQLEYLAKHTEEYRADALAEIDKRMGRN